MELTRILVILSLIAILYCLGTALYHLSSSKGDSKKMVRALAWRVALSIGLFLGLMIAWRLGYIVPHGVIR